MGACVVNVHGDNFGDFLNAAAGASFCGVLGLPVDRSLLARGDWQHLPNLDENIETARHLDGFRYPRVDVPLHAAGISHICPNRAVWSQLANWLASSDAVVSVPCGQNIGAYRDYAFLAPLIVAHSLGIPTYLAFGTVHRSGSWLYDATAESVLVNAAIGVRDSGSAELLESRGFMVPAPTDISLAEAGVRLSSIAVPAVRDVVSVVLGDALSWHPDRVGLEPGSEARSVAARVLRGVAEATRSEVEIVPHSPLPGEVDRLQGLLASVPAAEGGRFRVRSDIRSLSEYLEALGSSRLIVSLRYHGAIVAGAAGRPVISVAYESKHWSYMRQMGLDKWTLDAFDLQPRVLSQLVEEGLQQEESLAFQVQSAASDLLAISANSVARLRDHGAAGRSPKHSRAMLASPVGRLRWVLGLGHLLAISAAVSARDWFVRHQDGDGRKREWM